MTWGCLVQVHLKYENCPIEQFLQDYVPSDVPLYHLLSDESFAAILIGMLL